MEAICNKSKLGKIMVERKRSPEKELTGDQSKRMKIYINNILDESSFVNRRK